MTRINELAYQVVHKLHGRKLSVAESLTGGQLSAALTAVPGASNCFLGAVVAYTETTKHELLGVSRSTLEEFSAVSEQTAAEMAIGVLQRTNSDFSLATTGYAGPSAAMTSAVGQVYVAMARKSDQQIATSVIFLELACEETEKPCRAQIQEATVKAALELLLANI